MSHHARSSTCQSITPGRVANLASTPNLASTQIICADQPARCGRTLWTRSSGIHVPRRLSKQFAISSIMLAMFTALAQSRSPTQSEQTRPPASCRVAESSSDHRPNPSRKSLLPIALLMARWAPLAAPSGVDSTASPGDNGVVIAYDRQPGVEPISNIIFGTRHVSLPLIWRAQQQRQPTPAEPAAPPPR